MTRPAPQNMAAIAIMSASVGDADGREWTLALSASAPDETLGLVLTITSVVVDAHMRGRRRQK